jgi:hypothetical protein
MGISHTPEELADKMDACGHPFVPGSECDVLFVPGAGEAIRQKVDAMMQCTAAVWSRSFLRACQLSQEVEWP